MRSIPYRTSYFHCEYDRYNPRSHFQYFNWLEYENEQCEASSGTLFLEKSGMNNFL